MVQTYRILSSDWLFVYSKLSETIFQPAFFRVEQLAGPKEQSPLSSVWSEEINDFSFRLCATP